MMDSERDAPVRRIMIIEDEVLIGVLLEDMLIDLGYAVAGTASNINDALARVGADDFDAAVMDLNLNGSSSLPVADALMARGLPLLFVTGYGQTSLPPKYKAVPVLEKPFRQEGLAAKLAGVFAAG